MRDNGSGIDAHHQKVIREQLEAGESHHGLINSYRRLKYHFSEVSLVLIKVINSLMLATMLRSSLCTN